MGIAFTVERSVMFKVVKTCYMIVLNIVSVEKMKSCLDQMAKDNYSQSRHIIVVIFRYESVNIQMCFIYPAFI